MYSTIQQRPNTVTANKYIDCHIKSIEKIVTDMIVVENKKMQKYTRIHLKALQKLSAIRKDTNIPIYLKVSLLEHA